MSTHVDIESLEALAADQPISNGALVAAHLESCDECREELAWLRAERALFEKRADAQGSVEHLWAGVEDKHAQRKTQSAPYRANALPLPNPARVSSSRWWLLAAALPLVLAGTATFAIVKRARAARGVDAVVEQRAVGSGARLRVRVASADLQIERSASGLVVVRSAERAAEPRLVAIDARTFELRFERNPTERVRIEVPQGTALDITTSSGDVTIGAIGGATKILTSSGDIRAAELGETDITTTSGDVRVRSIVGSIAIRSSSGDIEVERSLHASRVLATSTSGSVQWAGRCALECAMQVRTNSGDVRLSFDRASAATVRFETSSGSFRDGTTSGRTLQQPSILWQMGSGVGVINVETTSGSLALDGAGALVIDGVD